MRGDEALSTRDDLTTPYQQHVEPTLAKHHNNARRRCKRPYKGFSTSIASSFVDPKQARVDCCALTCCGVLLSDQARYLIMGIQPPTLWKRMVVHVFFPLSIFLLAGYAALTIPDSYTNNLMTALVLALLLIYTVGACLRGRQKRAGIRLQLLRRLRELNHQQQDKYKHPTHGEHEEEEEEDLFSCPSDERSFHHRDDRTIHSALNRRSLSLPQTMSQINCVHQICCGCYKSDLPPLEEREEDVDYGPYNLEEADLCGCLWRILTLTCCGALCGCYIQSCGICALAQEGRELEKVIPAKRRRFDYITFQPFMEYYPLILNLRATKNTSMLTHMKAISRLSYDLIVTLAMTLVALLLISISPLYGRFRPGNMAVLVATFLQAFTVLFLVHWIYHKFDLSFDALVKYFACGFFLSTTSSIFFETVIQTVLQLSLSLIMLLFGVNVEENEGGYNRIPTTYRSGFAGQFRILASENSGQYVESFAHDHPIVYVIYLGLTAFVMAALVEEVGKYFGYIMVEHPDFLSRKELEDAATYTSPILATVSSDSETDEQTVEEEASRSPGMAAPDFSHQTRSLNSIGSGITAGMIAVAVGFACCENLLYIFLYNRSRVKEQLTVLMMRSLFPIHPLCAAIQSIGVCRRDLEKGTDRRLGRLLFPAVLLHGSYDFVIMVLNYLSSNQGEYTMVPIMLCYVSSALFVLFGISFFMVESALQRERLHGMDPHMDADSTVMRGTFSSLIHRMLNVRQSRKKKGADMEMISRDATLL